MALWGGRFAEELDQQVAEFSSSIAIDSRLWQVDIRVSIAHTQMLTAQKILSNEDGAKIVAGLKTIQAEIEAGTWTFSPQAEDVHGEIEARLFEKIGEPAKRMHTARSRNDQVATDTRLYLKENLDLLVAELVELQREFLQQAEQHIETLLPGMTHFQHAQPVSLAHHLLAYYWMFHRDGQRLQESVPRLLSMPLGSAALAGTGFAIDRESTRAQLGFFEIAPNSMDAVSDRDFVIEFLSNASIVMLHLSRFCEELIIWSAPEFAFVELGDAVTTGSSIMPQKKNPDVAELIRGRVGRVYGALMGALTMMKSLPLAYNRDMQEDKIHLFAGMDTTIQCVRLMRLMLTKAEWNREKMQKSLRGDFSNATDLADDLVEKGLSFREAHEVVGEVVRWCLAHNKILEELSVAELIKLHPKFDAVSATKLAHRASVQARKSEGGTSPEAVLVQIQRAKQILISHRAPV